MTDEPARERPRGNPPSDDLVDAALIDSFPASDPPPWTLGRRDRASAPPRRPGRAAEIGDEPSP